MASHQSIEKTLDRIVRETPGALVLNVELRVSDKGMVTIDGRPITDPHGDAMIEGGSVEAWNAANEIFSMYLRLFARRVRKRIKSMKPVGKAKQPKPPCRWSNSRSMLAASGH